MKKVFRIMLAAAMGVAMLGFTACKEKESNPDIYSFIYEGQAASDGQNIVYTATSDEVRNDWAIVEFLLENKTDANQQACLKVERIEGPEAMNDINICFGETCKTGKCPWTSEPFTLVPGINNDMNISFDYMPSQVTGKTVYRLTVGTGTSLSEPKTLLLEVK